MYVVTLAVFVRNAARILFEHARKVALRRKAEVGGDITVGVGGVGEQVFCQPDLFAQYKIRDGEILVLPEYLGQIIRVQVQLVGNVLDADFFTL